MPIHLKENLIVQLALRHKYRISMVLPFSKYAGHIFPQRKPNGKLRLVVDLRKINSLVADHYINNNHAFGILWDAAHHLARKSLFCKTECSQACDCLQMVVQRSVEFLAEPPLQQTCIRSQQIPVCLFKFHAWVVGPSCQSWLICSLRELYGNCSPQCYGPYLEHRRSLQVHSPGKAQADNSEKPIWSQTNWIPWQNHLTKKNFATR